MKLEDCSADLSKVSREQLEQWFLFYASCLEYILTAEHGEAYTIPADTADPRYRRIYVEDAYGGGITFRVVTVAIDVTK